MSLVGARAGSSGIDTSGDGTPPQGPPPDEQRFRTLVEHIPGVATFLDRVLVDDPGHSIPLYISPQVEEMFGYPLAEWLGESELWVQILHPEDRERMMAADAEARSTLSPLSEEYRLLARDGRVVWVSEKSSVVTDPATGTRYWQGVMLDITQRKVAEEALLASELKFRTLFDTAAIGVFTLDLDGRIHEANTTIERLGGYEAGDLNGQIIGELFDPEDARGLRDLEELRAGQRDHARIEHRFRRSNGSFFWCRTVLRLVRDASGHPAYAMGMLEDVSDRKALEEELMWRAVHDPLTGLPNRELLDDRLTMATAAAVRREGSEVGVVFVDLDDFKSINDALGHAGGDAVLIAVARRLTSAVRPADTVARFGGDEFVIVLTDISTPDEAMIAAERIRAALGRPFLIGGTKTQVTASLGVSVSSDAESRPEDLIRAADAAMYRAKRAGRDRVEASSAA